MAISQGGISSDAPIPDDLVAIYQGGQYFLDRMKAFQDAKDSVDAAFAQLKLGNEILGARAEAEENQRIANELREKAKQMLEGAETDATATVADAHARADALLEEANRKLIDANSDAEQIRQTANEYAEKVRAEAEEVRREATSRILEMNQIIAAATSKAAAADEAQIAAQQSKKEFEAAKADLDDRLARLREIMG